MKKTLLGFEPDFDFRLLALASNLPIYTLAWWMEQKLILTLQRIEDLQLTSRRNKQGAWFPAYINMASEEENELNWMLIGNKSSGSFLIPEQKAVDYYIKIEGDLSEEDTRSTLTLLKEIPGVQLAFAVNPTELESKLNLIL